MTMTDEAAVEDSAAIADGLSRLLADTYTLYLKTHNYHWNVTGPMFHTLHLLFETQYNELVLAPQLRTTSPGGAPPRASSVYCETSADAAPLPSQPTTRRAQCNVPRTT